MVVACKEIPDDFGNERLIPDVGDRGAQELGVAARNSMVNEGLLKKDSPHGIWEISDRGKQYLSQNRWSRLSGPQAFRCLEMRDSVLRKQAANKRCGEMPVSQAETQVSKGHRIRRPPFSGLPKWTPHSQRVPCVLTVVKAHVDWTKRHHRQNRALAIRGRRTAARKNGCGERKEEITLPTTPKPVDSVEGQPPPEAASDTS